MKRFKDLANSRLTLLLRPAILLLAAAGAMPTSPTPTSQPILTAAVTAYGGGWWM